jgi:CRP-like cAMP-binding protein
MGQNDDPNGYRSKYQPADAVDPLKDELHEALKHDKDVLSKPKKLISAEEEMLNNQLQDDPDEIGDWELRLDPQTKKIYWYDDKTTEITHQNPNIDDPKYNDEDRRIYRKYFGLATKRGLKGKERVEWARDRAWNDPKAWDDQPYTEADKYVYRWRHEKALKKVYPDEEDHRTNVLKETAKGMQKYRKKMELEEEQQRVLLEELNWEKGVHRQARLHEKYVQGTIKLTSRFMIWWDVILASILCFTGIVTTFEVAFLETAYDGLFFVNRIIDCLFLTDIWVEFHLAYIDSSGRVVLHRGSIYDRYVHGFFGIDLMTSIPFDMMFFIAGAGEGLAILKMVRVLKLLKMIRAVRLFKRMEVKMNITSANMSLIRGVVAVVISVHWIACFWGFLPSLEAGSSSWVTKLEEDSGVSYDSVVMRYRACLEFGFIILGMGYGNVKPETAGEKVAALFMLAYAGIVYAFALGEVFGALAITDPATSEYRSKTELLAMYVQSNRFDPELSMRLRDYTKFSEEKIRRHFYAANVLQHQAPSLKAEAAQLAQKRYLSKISYFNAPDPEERERFFVDLSEKLEPLFLPPQEWLYLIGSSAESMYIVVTGLCRRGKVVIPPNRTFGEEMLMKSSKRTESAGTMSYSNLFRLTRDDLLGIIKGRPYTQTTKLLRKRMGLLRFRLVVRELGRSHITIKKHRMGDRYKPMTQDEIDSYRFGLRQKYARMEMGPSLKEEQYQQRIAAKKARKCEADHIKAEQDRAKLKVKDARNMIDFYKDRNTKLTAAQAGLKFSGVYKTQKQAMLEGIDTVEEGDMDYGRFEDMFSRALGKVVRELKRETAQKLSKAWTQFGPVVESRGRALSEMIKSRFGSLESMADEQVKIFTELQADIDAELAEEQRLAERRAKKEEKRERKAKAEREHEEMMRNLMGGQAEPGSADSAAEPEEVEETPPPTPEFG